MSPHEPDECLDASELDKMLSFGLDEPGESTIEALAFQELDDTATEE